MSRVRPGTYSLRLAAEPSPLVGVDTRLQGIPVVVDGSNRVWWVEDNGDGTYLLSVRVGFANVPYYPRVDSGGNLVVEPSPNAWIIDGPDGGPNRIRMPGSNQVWTGMSPNSPGSPIFLTDLSENPVPQTQQWYFVNPQLQK